MDLLDNLFLNQSVLQKLAGILSHVFIGDSLKGRCVLGLDGLLVGAAARRALRAGL